MTENLNNKTLAILAHILGLFTGFLAPLIILLVSKEEYVKKHAKHALNWQISFLFYIIILMIITIIMSFFIRPFVPALFGMLFFLLLSLLFLLLSIFDIVFCIIAAIKANNNIVWKYPLAIPFIKA